MGHHFIYRKKHGEVSERFKELVLKISDSEMDRGFESHPLRQNAQIAQSVEQRTENPRVAGSIPALGTILISN